MTQRRNKLLLVICLCYLSQNCSITLGQILLSSIGVCLKVHMSTLIFFFWMLLWIFVSQKQNKTLLDWPLGNQHVTALFVVKKEKWEVLHQPLKCSLAHILDEEYFRACSFLPLYRWHQFMKVGLFAAFCVWFLKKRSSKHGD